MANEKNLTVLIIDDNEMTREVLRVTLRSDGYNVVGEAADGEAGLELALKLRPHIVCLDVLMPKISGLDALKQIKAKLPQTVVLMVTGSRDRDTIQTALQSGANGFILKPFTASTVLAAIEKAVPKARAK